MRDNLTQRARRGGVKEPVNETLITLVNETLITLVNETLVERL